jgi:hypothetical protein
MRALIYRLHLGSRVFYIIHSNKSIRDIFQKKYLLLFSINQLEICYYMIWHYILVVNYLILMLGLGRVNFWPDKVQLFMVILLM